MKPRKISNILIIAGISLVFLYLIFLMIYIPAYALKHTSGSDQKITNFSRKNTIPEFSVLVTSGDSYITISQADDYAINYQGHLDFSLVNDTLFVDGNFGIECPRVKEVIAKDNATVSIENFNQPQLKIDLSDQAKIKITKNNIDTLAIIASDQTKISSLQNKYKQVWLDLNDQARCAILDENIQKVIGQTGPNTTLFVSKKIKMDIDTKGKLLYINIQTNPNPIQINIQR